MRQQMKALSLWEPYASLIAWGEKRLETRSWQTPHRGLLAIHASKTKQGLRELPVNLRPALDQLMAKHEGDLAFGGVVCVAKLISCCRMTQAMIDLCPDTEKRWGFWQVGRFAWELEVLHVFKPPVYLRGQQLLFSVELEWPGES